MARFLSFYMLRKGYSASSIAPFEAIKKQFSQARKVMCLGKNIEHLKAASLVNNPNPSYLGRPVILSLTFLITGNG